MRHVANPPAQRPRAATPDEAEQLAREALAALDVLEPILAEETQLMREGAIRRALELSDMKAEASLRYQRALEDIKLNAIALGRFKPPALATLRERHERFAEALSLNMAVLGTARTVSESLVRDLAADVGRARNPQGYGAMGQQASSFTAPAAPLAVIKSA